MECDTIILGYVHICSNQPLWPFLLSGWLLFLAFGAVVLSSFGLVVRRWLEKRNHATKK